LGHRAAATLTTGNMLQIPEHGKSPRLYLATFAASHAFDHYGQMVEYPRMNGIVPPASAPPAQPAPTPRAARRVDPKASDGTILEAS